jgi:hypothetical protein
MTYEERRKMIAMGLLFFPFSQIKYLRFFNRNKFCIRIKYSKFKIKHLNRLLEFINYFDSNVLIKP